MIPLHLTPEVIEFRKAALAYADASASFFKSIDGHDQENKTAALGATIAALVDGAHSEMATLSMYVKKLYLSRSCLLEMWASTY